MFPLDDSIDAGIAPPEPARRPIDGTGRDLTWTQPDARRRGYELRAGEEVIATLGFERGGSAVAETTEGRWRFEQTGRLGRWVTVRVADTGAEVATFVPGWTGAGVLEVAGGSRFAWGPANLWRSCWVWRGEGEEPMLSVGSRHGPTKLDGRCTVEPAGRDRPELALLAMLGWYHLALRARATDDAAVTAAAVAAVG